MAAFNGTAPAVAPRDALVSPLAFAELDLVSSLHGGASPLAFSADDGATPMSLGCGCGCGKRWTEFYQDGVGDGPRPNVLPAALITTDVIADDTSTTATLTVDGDHVVSAIDMIGDQDFFAVQLVEGQTYDISMFLVVGGPNGVPLADAYIELYDSDGELVVTADGGGPNTPSGLDAVLTYTAENTGTYYVNARAWDEVALNGTTGDFVGDYEVFVTSVDATQPGAYVPFYRPDSPLHSIDWGSQFVRTSRNPDGDNGTRTDNGVANGQTPIDNNAYGIVGKNVITYYFAETGDVFVSEDPTNPGLTENIVAQGMQDWEMEAFETAFSLYEQVADIEYVRVFNRNEADIKVITYEGTPGVGASLLGRMSPPGEQNAGQMEVNSGDVRWTEEGVRPGGFYFPTLLHELGHGHGMAHPHDNGGRSSVMRGAEPSEDPVEGAIGGQFGDFGLSQQVYTVMSYNDGWNEGLENGGAPEGHGRPRSGGITGTEVDHFGWVGTLSALDIAVLQDKYGVNEEWATGDDTYVIGDVNEAGAYYSTIWDGGGEDEIRYTGARDATIDLRAATLRYEEGGGGRMSYALGAWTGFTIANGVTIERASSGDGDDVLIGNDADNILSGGGGRDSLDGGAGLDTASYAEAAGGVSVRLARGVTQNDGSGSVDLLAGIENIVGSAFADSIIGDAGANRISGGLGVDLLLGEAGDDILSGGAGPSNRLVGGLGDDRYIVEEAGDRLVERAGEGTDTVVTGLDHYELSAAHVENLILRASDGATGIGNGLANRIVAGDGDDTLIGRAGDDTFRGGGGDDAIFGGAGDDVAAMSGLRGQYQIVATADGYRITDSVGGRDGSDDLVGIERVRFGNGETVLIADLVAGASTTLSAKSEGPQIFPGLPEDDFVLPKDADSAPPVLPPLLDEDGVLLPDRAPSFRWVDRDDLFLDPDDFLQVDGGSDHGLHDWM